MPKPAPRLGKGLSAIIGPRASTALHVPTEDRPPSATQTSSAAGAGAMVLQHIPVTQISPNPRQPRTGLDQAALTQLAASIRRTGILQPVLVRPIGPDSFELLAGERRWRAAQLAGLHTVAAIVRDSTDLQSLELALIENLQREDLTPLERASAYQQLLEMSGVTAEVLADRLGESRASISNYLRLLNLAPGVQELISAGELGMGQARALAAIRDPQRQLALARLAVRRNLSVRQVEALVREPARAADTRFRGASPVAGHLAEIEQTFSKAVGLAVSLQPGRKKNSGRIVIRYNSLEEFDRIAEKLGASPPSE